MNLTPGVRFPRYEGDTEYDSDLHASENLARAVFAVARRIEMLACAVERIGANGAYAGESMGVLEKLGVDLPAAIQDGLYGISTSIDNHRE